MTRILLAVAALAACTTAASGTEGVRARVAPAPATSQGLRGGRRSR